jgi:hypothetical protein
METLTHEVIAERRHDHAQAVPERVMFRVAGLYGLSSEGVELPLNERESIHSGPVSITLDPESDPGSNSGLIDYERRYLKVSYGIQAVFPGLYDLVTSGDHDPGLLNPVRAVATDECSVTPELTGWRALGCLDFLPGSVWSGATGG